MTDPIDNAVVALVAHLTANVMVTYGNEAPAALRVQRGWAENNQDVDLRTPFAVVTHFSEKRHEHNPYLLDDVAGPPPYRWHVADLTFSGQLDLFCPHRRTRAEIGDDIRVALHDDLPFRPGLHLTAADYHNARITIHSERGRDSQMAAQAQVGEWRRTWDLLITCSEIVETSTPELSSVLLRVRTSDSGPTEDTTIP